MVSQREMSASLPPTARYRAVGARDSARQAELCALRVWRSVKDGYENILTVPSPVVARKSRSGADSVGT